MLQNRFGLERLLAHALSDRFELLVNQRRILGEMTAFARDRLGPMLGDDVTEILIALTATRAKAVAGRSRATPSTVTSTSSSKRRYSGAAALLQRVTCTSRPSSRRPRSSALKRTSEQWRSN